MDGRDAEARARAATILFNVLIAKPVWDNLLASLTAARSGRAAYILLTVAWRLYSPEMYPLEDIYMLLCERCCHCHPLDFTYRCASLYTPLYILDPSISWVRDAIARTSYAVATGKVLVKKDDPSNMCDTLELAMARSGPTVASIHAYGHLTLSHNMEPPRDMTVAMDWLIPRLLTLAVTSRTHAPMLRLARHISLRAYQPSGEGCTSSELELGRDDADDMGVHIRFCMNLRLNQLRPLYPPYRPVDSPLYLPSDGKRTSPSSLLSIMTWFELDRDTVLYLLERIDPSKVPDVWENAPLVNCLKAFIKTVARCPKDPCLDGHIMRMPMVRWCIRLLDRRSQVEVLRLARRVAIASALLAHFPSGKATRELRKAVRASLVADPGACREIPRFMRRFWHVPGR